MSFYNEDWYQLLRKYPDVARKIEELRCETVDTEEFNELAKEVERLKAIVKVLLEKNGVTTIVKEA